MGRPNRDRPDRASPRLRPGPAWYQAAAPLHGDESFAFGLECLLDGFAVRVARAGANGELARSHGDGFDLDQLPVIPLATVAERWSE